MGNNIWHKQKFTACTTRSVCTTQATPATHKFKIKNYSLLVGMGADECVSSTTFTAGGYAWNIDFCPDGDRREPGYVAAFLRLCDAGLVEGVRVNYRLSLKEKSGKLHVPEAGSFFVHKFAAVGTSCGNVRLVKKSKLRGESFTITCELIVIEKPNVQAVCTK